MFESHGFQKNLLNWYDQNRRELPWRAPKGQSPDPYHVWLSEIMLQQTTVPTVIPYFKKFLRLWPDLASFAQANRDDVLKEWAGLGYYARARNLHKCAITVSEDHGGVFPSTYDELITLPGVGPYTAAAISAIAFNKHAVVVDANVDRVTVRLFAIEKPIREAKPLIREKAVEIYAGTKRAGDLAQALMDLGSGVCVPVRPRCGICPVADHCAARKMGIQDKLPLKLQKKEKPARTGTVYWLEDGKGNILLERRADGRMLGGMAGLPTTDWDGKGNVADFQKPPNGLRLKDLSHAGNVYHSFSHFDLKLDIMKGRIAGKFADRYYLAQVNTLEKSGLPTVFKKVTKAMQRK